MSQQIDAQLTHVGVYVRDFERMVKFYQTVFGLVLTDTGPYKSGERIAFLSRNPNEHHQLVLATGRPADAVFSVVNQLSFRVGTLAELKAMYARLMQLEVPIVRTVTHGNAWSIYASDPEENRIEIYTHSDWYVAQPFSHPVDLTQPEAFLLRQNREFLDACSDVVPRAEWSKTLASRIQNALATKEI